MRKVHKPKDRHHSTKLIHFKQKIQFTNKYTTAGQEGKHSC